MEQWHFRPEHRKALEAALQGVEQSAVLMSKIETWVATYRRGERLGRKPTARELKAIARSARQLRGKLGRLGGYYWLVHNEMEPTATSSVELRADTLRLLGGVLVKLEGAARRTAASMTSTGGRPKEHWRGVLIRSVARLLHAVEHAPGAAIDVKACMRVVLDAAGALPRGDDRHVMAAVKGALEAAERARA